MNADIQKILYNRAKISKNLDKILLSTRKSNQSKGQLSLFGEESVEIEVSLEEPIDFDPYEIARREKDVIGFNLLYSPFDDYETVRLRYCNSTINQSLNASPKEIQTILVNLKSIEYKTSQRGNSYAKLVFNDRETEERFYLFGDLYKKKIKDCFLDTIYLLSIEMNLDGTRLDIVNFMPAREIDIYNKCSTIYISTTIDKLEELRMYLKCYMMGDKQDVFVKITDMNDMILPSICKVKIDNENLLEMTKKGFIIKIR